MFPVNVFKCMNDLHPVFMSNTFVQRNVPYDLRDNSKLIIPDFNTIRFGKKSFRYYGSHLWNHVPSEFKAATSIFTFKKLIKTWNGPNCQCNLCSVLS